MGLMSENRDPEVVRRDRRSAEFFDPLREVIAEELFARISVRDGLDTVQDDHDVAELDRRGGAGSFRCPTPVRGPGPSPSESTGSSRLGRHLGEVRDLSVAYGAKKAVDRISLEITRGEIFGLLGPNGAGKTSTLSAIEGLVKPQSGAVFLDGIDVRRHPSQAKAKLGVQLHATSFQS